MHSISTSSPSTKFFRFGAGCCVYYIAAQLIQEITFHFGINDSAFGEAEIIQRLTRLDELRAALILLGFTFVPILAAFAGVALRRYRIRPAAAMLGFAFSLLFVAAEMSIRSIDLFLVSRNWAVAYGATASATMKTTIAARVEIWNESVGALYFALLSVHMLSSICFAIATWDRNEAWNRLVAIGFALGAMESIGRLAESYLAQAWLDSLNHFAYFPVVLVNFGTLAVWLWKQAQSGTQTSTGRTRPSAGP